MKKAPIHLFLRAVHGSSGEYRNSNTCSLLTDARSRFFAAAIWQRSVSRRCSRSRYM